MEGPSSGRYRLKCQHARRVFTDEEIAGFQLKRRKETPDIRFNIAQIYGHAPQEAEFGDDEEKLLELEM